MVNATTSDGNSKDTNSQIVREERWRARENYKDDGSSTARQLGNTTEVDIMRFKDLG